MWPEESHTTITAAGRALIAMESVPVNLPSLARQLDATLHSARLKTGARCYIEPYRDGFRIVVNSADTPNRQRFTAAHAIGHLVFDRAKIAGLGCNDDTDYRNSPDLPHFNPAVDARREKRATDFAVTLLMPEKKVLQLYRLAPDNVPGIASFLGVSEAALQMRVEFLLKRNPDLAVTRSDIDPAPDVPA